MTIQDKAQHFFFDNKKEGRYLDKDDFFAFVNSLEEGSESYWKKRCLLSEEMYAKLNAGMNHKKEYAEWQQLKSSIGEETEGQDELKKNKL